MNSITAPQPLLEIDGLSVTIASRRGTVAAVRDVSFAVAPGEILGIVGESGSGKSVTALAVMGILSAAARVDHGSIRFAGRALNLTGRRRGDREGLAIIFQNPRAALDPIRPVGRPLVDALRAHSSLSASGRGICGRASGPSAHPRARAAILVVSVRVVGRHVPACNDRDRTGVQAASVDR